MIADARMVNKPLPSMESPEKLLAVCRVFTFAAIGGGFGHGVSLTLPDSATAALRQTVASQLGIRLGRPGYRPADYLPRPLRKVPFLAHQLAACRFAAAKHSMQHGEW